MQQQYRTSRSTVREAITELQSCGLISTRHGGGSFCNNLLDPFFQTAADDGLRTGQALPDQVLEMRQVLEGEAAFYCARRASSSELVVLQQEYERMSRRKRGGTTLRQAKADLMFHMLIADNSHHLLVLSLSQILYSRYFNAIYAVLSQTFKKQGRYPQLIGAQHRQIYQAICDRDGEAAREAARQHIGYTRSLLLG